MALQVRVRVQVCVQFCRAGDRGEPGVCGSRASLAAVICGQGEQASPSAAQPGPTSVSPGSGAAGSEMLRSLLAREVGRGQGRVPGEMPEGQGVGECWVKAVPHAFEHLSALAPGLLKLKEHACGEGGWGPLGRKFS